MENFRLLASVLDAGNSLSILEKGVLYFISNYRRHFVYLRLRFIFPLTFRSLSMFYQE